MQSDDVFELADWCGAIIQSLAPKVGTDDYALYANPLAVNIAREFVQKMIVLGFADVATGINIPSYGRVQKCIGLLAHYQRFLLEFGERLAAQENSDDDSEEPEELPSDSEQATSPPVILGRRDEPAIVLGKRKPALTTTRYNVVKALLASGEDGLTKDQLVNESKHSDARQILKRLAQSDSDWNKVIIFPGITGGRYRHSPITHTFLHTFL